MSTFFGCFRKLRERKYNHFCFLRKHKSYKIRLHTIERKGDVIMFHLNISLTNNTSCGEVLII